MKSESRKGGWSKVRSSKGGILPTALLQKEIQSHMAAGDKGIGPLILFPQKKRKRTSCGLVSGRHRKKEKDKGITRKCALPPSIFWKRGKSPGQAKRDRERERRETGSRDTLIARRRKETRRYLSLNYRQKRREEKEKGTGRKRRREKKKKRVWSTISPTKQKKIRTTIRKSEGSE